MDEPIPVTGAWRPGDNVGHRRFFTFATDRRFALDSGATLCDVTVAYETWGRLNDDASNAVLMCHAWTGDTHVTGPAGRGHLDTGVVGRHGRDRGWRSTPSGGSWCARTCSAVARARPARRRRTRSTGGRTRHGSR